MHVCEVRRETLAKAAHGGSDEVVSCYTDASRPFGVIECKFELNKRVFKKGLTS